MLEQMVFPSRRYVPRRELGRGGMGVVYEVYDRLTGQHVALKRMHAQRGRSLDDGDSATPTLSLVGPPRAALHPAHAPSEMRSESTLGSAAKAVTVREAAHDSELLTRRHLLIEEFRILATLRHPYIISVFDYGLDATSEPFFTMELLDSALLLRQAAAQSSLKERIYMLAQISRALTYLHRRGVVHRDLKPGNVLVTRQGDSLRCKVLDFGLAVAARQPGNQELVNAGTLAYMAPELLDGAAPSAATDLFALGVIGYELLSGIHPFDTKTEQRLRSSIKTQEPDLDGLPVERELRECLRQLLDKEPGARPTDVATVTQVLARAAGVATDDHDIAVRDSFLQAATLIGREHELDVINRAVTELSMGSGGALLIGGESGVGKSRLLEEARVAALTRGALVLSGQAADAGSSAHAHQLLREVFRSAVLFMEPPPTDFEAGVLLPVVPDLPHLLQRDVVSAPELNAKAMQERLFEVMEAGLLRSGRPVVLLLDDLQWLSPDTLAFLQRLVRRTKSVPILLIGTFRNDEAPRLPEWLDGVQVLKLGRLDPSQTARLSEAMLGPTGNRPGFVELLQRETAGNAYFIVEVVRALASEAGGLGAVGLAELPQKVGGGGMIAILEGRLNRANSAQRPLLELAAIMGRQLDRTALATVMPAAELDAWLHALAEQAILEPIETEWRFCHDKLRERLLDLLPASRKHELHAQAAQAIAAGHRDQDAQASALAHHYAAAGQAERAAHYLDRAGEAALLQGAMQQAERLLADAIVWQERCPEGAFSLFALVRTRRLRTATLIGLGRLGEGIAEMDKMLALCGFPCEKLNPSFVAHLLEQLAAQGLRWLGRTPHFNPALLQDVANEVLLCTDCVGPSLVMRCDARRMLFVSLLGINLAERFQLVGHHATCASILAFALFAAGLTGLSQRYMQIAEELRAKVKDLRVDENFYTVRACLAQCVGNWQGVETDLAVAIELCHRLGDSTREQLDQLVLLSNRYFTARYEATLADVETLERLAVQSGNAQYQGWCVLARVAVALQQGRFQEAHQMLAEAQAVVAASKDVVAEAALAGLLALTALRVGRTTEARQLANETFLRIEKQPLMGHGMMEGPLAPAEVFLTLWQQATERRERRRLWGLFAGALRQARRYSRQFWFVRPRLLLWESIAHCGHHRRDPSLQKARAALQAAEKLQLPLETGLAHKALSELEGGAAAAEHERRAVDIFSGLGAAWRISVRITAPMAG